MKTSRLLLSTLVAATLVACGNSSDINPDGTAKNLVWPKVDHSSFNHDGSQFGSWPNWDNVRSISRGMNKDQIRQLIGNPQFSEGFYGVREWDYVFNFRENGVHKICQYKVLFDKEMNAQSFLWYPNGCYRDATFTLSADFLFDFDKSTLTPNGVEVVTKLAQDLKAMASEKVSVIGYTDRMGSVDYNLSLGQRRADTVKAKLQAEGVKAEIITDSKGKSVQVKECNDQDDKALKSCLRPNRRVEVIASVKPMKVSESFKVESNTGEMKAGSEGPAPLYEK